MAMPCGGWPDAGAVCGAEASVTNASVSPFDEVREGVSILVDEFVKKKAEKQKARGSLVPAAADSNPS